jgi:hypothetical protein
MSKFAVKLTSLIVLLFGDEILTNAYPQQKKMITHRGFVYRSINSKIGLHNPSSQMKTGFFFLTL